MPTVTLEEAQAKLPERIDGLQLGESLVITRDAKPVARLLSEEQPKLKKPRVPGLAKGLLTIIEDDDEHLKDFAEYMP